MITVQLTWPEILMASHVGVMRQVQNLKRGAKHRHGCDPADGFKINIEGAIGELALARMTNQYWSGAVGDYDADDVGELQSRAVSNKKHRLILHKPDDKKHRPDKAHKKYVLMIINPENSDVTARGWVYGYEGQKEQYWEDPTGEDRPAYFVPHGILRHMETLEELAI